MNDICWPENLVNHYAKLIPGLKEEFVGADRNIINELERLSRVKFPNDYKNYLEVMGKNDAGLLANINVSTRIDILLEAYEEYEDFPEDFVDPPWFLIGVGNVNNDIVMNVDNGKLHRAYTNEVGDFFASDFRCFVERTVFKNLIVLNDGNYETVTLVAKSILPEGQDINTFDFVKYIISKFSNHAEFLYDISDSNWLNFGSDDLNLCIDMTSTDFVLFASGEERRISSVTKLCDALNAA